MGTGPVIRVRLRLGGLAVAVLPTLLIAAFATHVLAAPAGAATPDAGGGRPVAVDFAREVRPILNQHCLSCHGGVRRKGGLSLLSAADAGAPASSGERAVVPGRPDQSELVRRIVSHDPDERMPANGPPLDPRQVEVLRRWVATGAAWPRHWAFEPVARPEPPPVRDAAAARNLIDRFVLSQLEARGVASSPPAEPHVLLRRLSLDLTGLPPTPAEVEAFLKDVSPGAYERQVDRLLASPHFGERWGRHWLDLARYADTDGYEVDGTRPTAWRYRDWVIDAVNADLPYDRFTIEQLAGDLLPGGTPAQRLATAFHRQTLTNNEGGIDKEEYRVAAVMDRVSTTATVWLGLTAGCAQCHDHPYDPLRQREYYGLFAFFNNADEATANLGGVKVEVMAERQEPRQTFLLDRGNFLEPKRDQPVPPGVPAAMHGLRPRRPDPSADRLDLAHWLVDPANPLARRVAVNHAWQHLFGTGLVRTPDDFGATGEPPTHPELLDWLADEFRRLGWSRKALVRLVVTSAAYRQSSRHRPELAHIDPQNVLLHRQNRFRVEAELVRDLSLSAAGLLSPKVGGPSVFPPIPKDLAKIDFRSDMKWVESTGEDRYRRGMYTFFKRTLPDPNLTTFDCPDASATNVRRAASNTPVQALATLNNEVFAEAARALGRRLAGHAGTDADRLAMAYRLAVAREPRPAERDELLGLLDRTRRHYRADAAAAKLLAGDAEGPTVDVAAWVTVAGVVLNLDEFLTRE